MDNHNYNRRLLQEDPDHRKPEGSPPNITPEVPPQITEMEAPPPSAPPDFIPEPPAMQRGAAPGMQRPGNPNGFGRTPGPFRPEAPGREDEMQGRSRGLRGCINRFTYIWLFNGEGFWFYPTFVDGRFVRGFRWRRNRWVFDRIYIRRIFYFRCF